MKNLDETGIQLSRAIEGFLAGNEPENVWDGLPVYQEDYVTYANEEEFDRIIYHAAGRGDYEITIRKMAEGEHKLE